MESYCYTVSGYLGKEGAVAIDHEVKDGEDVLRMGYTPKSTNPRTGGSAVQAIFHRDAYKPSTPRPRASTRTPGSVATVGESADVSGRERAHLMSEVGRGVKRSIVERTELRMT